MIWQGTSLIDDSSILATATPNAITFGDHELEIVSSRPTNFRAVDRATGGAGAGAEAGTPGAGAEYALRKTSITVTRYTANCDDRTYIVNRTKADSFAAIFSTRREIRAVNLGAFSQTGPDFDVSATNAPGTYSTTEVDPDAWELNGIAADPAASTVIATTLGTPSGDLLLEPRIDLDWSGAASNPIALDLVFISWALTFVDTPTRRTLY